MHCITLTPPVLHNAGLIVQQTFAAHALPRQVATTHLKCSTSERRGVSGTSASRLRRSPLLDCTPQAAGGLPPSDERRQTSNCPLGGQVQIPDVAPLPLLLIVRVANPPHCHKAKQTYKQNCHNLLNMRLDSRSTERRTTFLHFSTLWCCRH